MSGATEELSGLAQKLQELVEQFRLSQHDEDGKLPAPQARAVGGNGNGNGNGRPAGLPLLTLVK